MSSPPKNFYEKNCGELVKMLNKNIEDPLGIIKEFAREKNLNLISSIDLAIFYKGFIQDFFFLFHKRPMNHDIDISDFESLLEFLIKNRNISFENYVKHLNKNMTYEKLGFIQKFSYLNLYGFAKSMEVASIGSNFIKHAFEVEVKK